MKILETQRRNGRRFGIHLFYLFTLASDTEASTA